MNETATDRGLSPGLRVWSAVVSLVIPPLLWLISFQKLAGVLERGRPRMRADALGFQDRELADFVDGLLHRLPGPWRHTCLKRSAILFYLLRSAGRPIHLHIGVRRDEEGSFLAHSWLLQDGALYLEPDDEGAAAHTVIARFPEAPSTP